MIVGSVLSFRIGMKRRYSKELLIKLGESKSDVAKLIGKKVVVEDLNGNKYIGKVLKPHGRNGVAVVSFRKDLPGQVIGLRAKVLTD